MQFRVSWLLYCACAIAPSLAAAQTGGAQPHPADAAARVPPFTYESAFANYARFREEKPAPWREINDEVGRVGGHLGILKGSGHAGHGAPPAKTPAPAGVGSQGR